MIIIGHRGSAGTHLENTMAAIRAGWQSGADGVEIDVRLTADGQIAVHHDSTTARLSKQNVRIKKVDAQILRELSLDKTVGESYQVPFLDEVLLEMPNDKQLFIEIKSSERMVPLLKVKLQGLPPSVLENITIISFRSKVIQAVREQLPKIPTLYLAEKPLGRQHNKKPLELAKAIDTHGLGLSYRGLTTEVARAIKSAGLYLNAWTVNDISEILPLEIKGVDALTTDFPEAFCARYGLIKAASE